MRTALFTALALIASAPLRADLRPDKIHVADAKKNQFYIRDGMVVGGDKAISQVMIKDIRRASNPAGFERVVIDLEGNLNGEPAAIERPPYYQASITPDERRLVFTIWGSPKLAFDSRKVVASFKKSRVFTGISLLPVLEADSWTFSLGMKGAHPVEIFELTNPARIIIDVRTKK